MRPVQNQAEARDQIQRQLVALLHELPGNVRFSRQHPQYPHATLSAGRISADESASPAENVPVRFSVSYWVIVRAEEVSRYFGLIVGSWRINGWPVSVSHPSAPRTGWAETPDGCELTLMDNGRDSLSIEVLSGTFPPSGIDREAMPMNIPPSNTEIG